MSQPCENIDGQCGASWCDCDYQRRKRTAEPCYYCSGPHEDDPCPVRVADAERYRRQGEAMYPIAGVLTLEHLLKVRSVISRQQLDDDCAKYAQEWICGLERDRKRDSQ